MPPIPKVEALSKQELQKILSKFSTSVIRAEMIEVIKQLRPCSEKEAKDIKILKPGEVTEVIKRFS